MTPRLRAILRSDFAMFVIKCFEQLHPGQPPLAMEWYLKAMAHHLTEAASGRMPRLVITVPPRHLKSITAAVALPAFLLGHGPAKMMVASYSQDLARQHAEQTRQIIESPWYQELFPSVRIAERGNRQLELTTTTGGVRKAVSVGGTVTGFGADILIIDDCMKAEDAASQLVRDSLLAWFDGTLMTRLNDKACQSACKRDPLSARKRDPLSRWRKVDRTRAFALRAA